MAAVDDAKMRLLICFEVSAEDGYMNDYTTELRCGDVRFDMLPGWCEQLNNLFPVAAWENITQVPEHLRKNGVSEIGVLQDPGNKEISVKKVTDVSSCKVALDLSEEFEKVAFSVISSDEVNDMSGINGYYTITGEVMYRVIEEDQHVAISTESKTTTTTYFLEVVLKK